MGYDLFRPVGAFRPLLPERRVLRLAAAFDGGNPGYRRPRGYERAMRGTFDADCTLVGDYLVGARGTLFVAMLPALQRPLCVLTNALLDVVRPAGGMAAGLNGYGGVQEGLLQPVLSGWPGEVLGGAEGAPGSLPDDGGMPRWTVLLPPTPVPIQGSDLVQDGAGRRFVVRVAERSELGWRLVVRQAGI